MAAAVTTRRHRVRWDWVLFALLFLLEAGYGIYLGYFQNVLLGDAVSRTANAFYVLYCKPYSLTSMGLVWNPLPSFLQLPFVLLSKLWRPLVTKGIGAAIVTALFAAWQGQTLLHAFDQHKVKLRYGLPITLLFCLNPYVLFYGANGMSEIMFIAFGIRVICSLSLWLRTGKVSHMVTMAAGFVGMFLVRYEAIPFAIFVALGMCIQILFSKRERQLYASESPIETFYYVEGTMWITFFPLIYVVLVWILYNWSITGNPFYFLNSGYSMSAYSAYYTSYGGFLGAISFVWVRLWPFLLLVAGLMIVRLFSGTLLRPNTIIILLSTLGLSVFTLFMIATGKSGGYVRYVCYPLMFAAAWIPWQLGALREKGRKLASLVLCAVLAVTSGYFVWAFEYSTLMREDTLLGVPARSEEVANYINANLGDSRILMDAYRTYYIIMNVDNVDNLVISSSEDFEDAVEDPAACDIDYVVVPQIGSYGNMDALNIAYPDLYNYGADWCTEVISIGEFKIFRVFK